MLGQLATNAEVVVADFEAGLGTVLRLADGSVDVVIVVVEPTANSLDVGRRAAEVVSERALGRLVITANRVRDDGDLARVAAAFPGLAVIAVPDEATIVAAERAGTAPLDHAPDSPGVLALLALAETVLPSRPPLPQG